MSASIKKDKTFTPYQAHNAITTAEIEFEALVYPVFAVSGLPANFRYALAVKQADNHIFHSFGNK
ncbi:hypothetical protein NBG4_640006 [Candidatus Sulfobium mesophilum]|uniref:Uncharacterized protein n=1 Tax=Candidatus Sulfobium mesophilum TaxID=2016548 RepID=A0A2U3QJS7_9BACT|nr:hypothetical protein NBG4_640006 [Candidatus Sulfobium mesophilum]